MFWSWLIDLKKKENDIKGVTKRYSATCKQQTNERFVQVVSFFGCVLYSRQQWQRLTNLLFGQSQQAGSLEYEHRENGQTTTKVVHAYKFNNPG